MPVTFHPKALNQSLEVVQSLAKWKRMALYLYDFHIYNGLYTDMNAIRQDEELDEIHSLYVDQWDWELAISENDRNMNYLKKIVNKITNAIYKTQRF